MASVAMTPMRRSRVACTAARAPGMTTPTIGVENEACSCGSAAAAAELHATMMSFTPRSIRAWAAAKASRRTSASGFGP